VTALTLALLAVLATYPDYPKPAAAQHEEWIVNQVKGTFEDLGFVTKGLNKLLTTVYPGIKLPTGYEILNFHGGEQAVRKMLADWSASQDVIDGVIAKLSTNDPINRKYDVIITIAGRNMNFLVEIKSVNDLNVNVQQTVIEALYDSYMAATGDAVIWVTQGSPCALLNRTLAEELEEAAKNMLSVEIRAVGAERATARIDEVERPLPAPLYWGWAPCTTCRLHWSSTTSSSKAS
jgi:hypothetical protein